METQELMALLICLALTLSISQILDQQDHLDEDCGWSFEGTPLALQDLDVSDVSNVRDRPMVWALIGQDCNMPV